MLQHQDNEQRIDQDGRFPGPWPVSEEHGTADRLDAEGYSFVLDD
jgi:hypothetical protein